LAQELFVLQECTVQGSETELYPLSQKLFILSKYLKRIIYIYVNFIKMCTFLWNPHLQKQNKNNFWCFAAR